MQMGQSTILLEWDGFTKAFNIGLKIAYETCNVFLNPSPYISNMLMAVVNIIYLLNSQL